MYTCKSGRVVEEFAMSNGATHVEISGGANLTESEWEEYCAHVRALSLEQSRQRKATRKHIEQSNQV